MLVRPHDATTSPEELNAAVGAWKARVIARSPQGEPTEQSELAPSETMNGADYGGVCLGYSRALKSGTLELAIDEPAPVISPASIEFYVRNHLCGLERMPVFIDRSIGVAAAILALIAAAFVPMRRVHIPRSSRL